MGIDKYKKYDLSHLKIKIHPFQVLFPYTAQYRNTGIDAYQYLETQTISNFSQKFP